MALFDRSRHRSIMAAIRARPDIANIVVRRDWDVAPAERLQNARRKKLIVGYKSWILPAMNGCSPNQQPRKGTAHEALLRPRRLLHGPAHRGSRSRTHLRSRAG